MNKKTASNGQMQKNRTIAAPHFLNQSGKAAFRIVSGGKLQEDYCCARCLAKTARNQGPLSSSAVVPHFT